LAANQVDATTAMLERERAVVQKKMTQVSLCTDPHIRTDPDPD
jgi:hypothetical protein